MILIEEIEEDQIENPDEREYILASGLRPYVLTDGEHRYWDGHTCIDMINSFYHASKKTVLRQVTNPKRLKEMRLMIRLGHFPEANPLYLLEGDEFIGGGPTPDDDELEPLRLEHTGEVYFHK